MGLLALGVVGGYGSAAVSFARHARAHREVMRHEMLRDVRGACAEGARAEQQQPQQQAKTATLMLQITQL